MSWLGVGQVRTAHGVRGLIKVALDSPPSESVLQAQKVRIEERCYSVLSARPLGGKRPALLLELEGIGSRDQAMALQGRAVEIEREALALGPGEYFVADLKGCNVVDLAGQSLGEVSDTFDSGAHEVLELSGGEMIPLVKEWVLEVDLDARRIVIDPHE